MDHFPVKLRKGCNGVALLAFKPPETAVIFVHGFAGNPVTTWSDFEHLVEVEGQRALWGQCDLYFYGYRCRNQIAPLAEDFVEFLGDVAATKERATAQIEFTLPSSSDKKYSSSLRLSMLRGNDPYKSLTLVGHSTGAVIIREAIRLKVRQIGTRRQDLAAWLAQPAQPGSAEYADQLVARALLRFFAPAHLGVMAAGCWEQQVACLD